MDLNEQSEDVCLDIAVDHRIKALCKRVPAYANQPSGHVLCIRELGENLGLPQENIQVTSQLAGPAVTGGIAIILQQPRSNHPFKQGIDRVIEDCKTLYALYDIFRMVSCETLDIRDDVAIVVLLPYESEPVNEIHDADLAESSLPSRLQPYLAHQTV